MDHDLDPLVGQPEEVVGLDDLEALVHEGRRVDRDAAAHPPGGMVEGLLGGDRLELLGRPSAEGAAGGGEDAGHHRSRGTPSRSWNIAECSESTGDAGARAGAGRVDQLPAHDQALLVGERHRQAPLERGQGRGRPAAPTIPFSTTSGSLASMRSPWSRPPPEWRCARPVGRRLLVHLADPAAARQAAAGHVGGRLDHLEGLHADGPRAAEDEDADHASECSEGPRRARGECEARANAPGLTGPSVHQGLGGLAEGGHQAHRGVEVVRVAGLDDLVDVAGGDRDAAGRGAVARQP